MENPQQREQCTDTSHLPCPFCSLQISGILAANDFVVAVPDAFPVSPGHTFIIPKRHFASFFAATVDEKTALLGLLAENRERLLQERSADGFYLGINGGAVAGHTFFISLST
jgi:diadenosine tetraphosphate (Ap4A) HIT family hydrolase